MFWESQANLNVFQWILRGVVTYGWLFLLTKLMGQRLVGRLSLLDFIIAVTIGSIAAAPLGNSMAGLKGAVITLTTFALINIILSYLALKMPRFRRVVQGEPVVLVKNGKLLEDTMRKRRVDIDDLLMGIREKNIPDIADVEFALLEPNGKFSVIPKSQSRPVRPKDLKIDTDYEGLPVVVIEDGNIIEDNLIENNLNVSWLLEQLKDYDIEDVKEVMLGVLNTKGNLYLSIKGESDRSKSLLANFVGLPRR